MKNGGKTRLSEALNVYLAPVLLVLVACFQIYSAFAHDQTPWKGGGFGMFSTVDSPGARFLKVYLVTGDGEVAVRIPPRLSRLRRVIRTSPTPHNLDLMARSLTEETWVDAPYPYLFHSLDLNKFRQRDVASGASQIREAETRTRSKLPEEPEFPAELVVAFDAIRVELWKYRYELDGETVRAAKKFETSARRVIP